MKNLVAACVSAMLVLGGTVWANDDAKALRTEMKALKKQLAPITKKLAKEDEDLKTARTAVADTAKAFKESVSVGVKANAEAGPLQTKISELSTKMKELRKAKAEKDAITPVMTELKAAKKELNGIMKSLTKEPAQIEKAEAAKKAKKAYADLLTTKLRANTEANPILIKMEEIQGKLKALKPAKGKKDKKPKKKKDDNEAPAE